MMNKDHETRLDRLVVAAARAPADLARDPENDDPDRHLRGFARDFTPEGLAWAFRKAGVERPLAFLVEMRVKIAMGSLKLTAPQSEALQWLERICTLVAGEQGDLKRLGKMVDKTREAAKLASGASSAVGDDGESHVTRFLEKKRKAS